MRVNGLGTRRRVAAAAGVVAVVLAGASFSWACTDGAESLTVTREGAVEGETLVAAPGDTLIIEGRSWVPGTVQIYLAASPNIPLADNVPIVGARAGTRSAAPMGGQISVRATIPAGLAPGPYAIRVAHSNGKISKNVMVNLQVTAPPSAVGHNAPATNGVANVPAAPAAGEVPTVAATADPAPVAPAGADQATETVAAAAPTAGDSVFVAEPLPPVAPADWAGAPAGTGTDPLPKRSLDGTSESTNGGLLVGAGFLAVGSVALFGGFAVAIARRRKVAALATPGF